MNSKSALNVMIIIAKSMGENRVLDILKEELDTYLLLSEKNRKEKKKKLLFAVNMAMLALDERDLPEMIEKNEIINQASQMMDRLNGGN